jgi:hypothetical protein
VRHSELLDWLERRLHLQWLVSVEPLAALAGVVPVAAPRPGPGNAGQAAPEPAATPLATAVLPPRADLLALQTLVQLGYYRGIVNKLSELAAAHPQCSSFTRAQDTLARQYQFETMLTHLQKALDEPVH